MHRFLRFLVDEPDYGGRTIVAVARTNPLFFSAVAMTSPVSTIRRGECQAITNRTFYEWRLDSSLYRVVGDNSRALVLRECARRLC